MFHRGHYPSMIHLHSNFVPQHNIRRRQASLSRGFFGSGGMVGRRGARVPGRLCNQLHPIPQSNCQSATDNRSAYICRAASPGCNPPTRCGRKHRAAR